MPDEIIHHAPRRTRVRTGDTVTVYAGGRHVYLPAGIRQRAGLGHRLVIYHDRQTRTLRFVAATERTMRQSWSCRTGLCGATAFPRIFGYVPDTTWVPVEVIEGAGVVLRLADLYQDAREFRLREAS